jgi:hypothetical protein
MSELILKNIGKVKVDLGDIAQRFYLKATTLSISDVAPVLQRLNEGDVVVKFIGIPTTYVDEHGSLRNGAFLLKPNTPAERVMRVEDLCGGVSAFAISDLGLCDNMTEEKKDRYIHTKLKEFCTSGVAFLDFSVEYLDAPSNQIEAELPCLSLGKHNSSIGVYKKVNPRNGSTRWFIVVRTYDQNKAKVLSDFIRSDPKPTLDDTHGSSQYTDAIESSDRLRSSIAKELAKAIGFTLENPDGKRKGVITNHYNFLRPMRYSDGQRYICYYERTFWAAEDDKKVALFGLNRISGYQLLTFDGVKSNIKDNEYINAYPMGTPKLHRDRDAFIKRLSTMDNPKKKAKLIREGKLSRVLWGGHYPHHYKAVTGLYSGSDGKNGDTSWEDLVSYLAPLSVIHVHPSYLVAVAVYISSVPASQTSIQEIILFADDSSPTVKIPLTNKYLRQDLFSDYIKYKEKNKASGIKWTDLYVDEDNNFLLFKREQLLLIYSTDEPNTSAATSHRNYVSDRNVIPDRSSTSDNNNK